MLRRQGIAVWRVGALGKPAKGRRNSRRMKTSRVERRRQNEVEEGGG